MELGSLHNAIREYEFSYALKLHCLLDVSRGMNFLHQSSLLHRDLKPGIYNRSIEKKRKTDNVLMKSLDVKAPVCCKITDFGTTRDFAAESMMTQAVGTPSKNFYAELDKYCAVFMAPEVVNSSKYAKSADVYSFSLLAFEGTIPCNNLRNKKKQ